MPIARFFVFLFFSIGPLCYNVSASPCLILTRLGSRFQLRIYEHETLTFRIKEETVFQTGILENLTDSSVFVFGAEILVRDIGAIDIRGKNYGVWSFRSSPGKLITSGIILWTADMLNQRERLSPAITVISGGLILSGILMKVFERKYFTVNQRNKLNVIGI